jgi:large subunit ribosomal protein L21
MKYAIIEDGGKQFKAIEGETIEVDYFASEIGEGVDLDRVLFIADGDNVAVGTPFVEGALVQATVVSQVKAPKVTIFRYKPKIHYRVKRGHRQKYTRLHIDSIMIG